MVTSTFHDEYNPEPQRRWDHTQPSEMSEAEREAQLRAGLAQRLHDLKSEKPIDDRRLTWMMLHEMFYAEKKVSRKTASAWADMIVDRGVKRE